MKKISIVVPCFNESENIAAISKAILEQQKFTEHQLSLIFVDDGSSDETWAVIENISAENHAVSGICLSRNFGHQYALLAGLSEARGDAVIMLDGDLQHPPSLIPEMIEKWTSGAEIVTTTRLESEDVSFLKRLTSSAFYKVFSLLSGVKMTPGQADFRLLDAKVLRTITSMPEYSLFLRGIVSWVGYCSENIVYQAAERHAGTSKYSWKKMISFSLDAIFSFSNLPLRLSAYFGIFLFVLSMIYLCYTVIIRLAFANDPTSGLIPGWASIVVLICFFFSILFIQLGIFGEYINRIFTQVKSRPRYIISQTTSEHSRK